MAAAVYYPRASRAHWYATAHPGSLFDRIDKLLLHTTEGTSLPDYTGGADAPTLTAIPDVPLRRLHWWQHFPVNMSARALRHTRTTPTNGARVVQVELVGTSEPAGPGMYWPEAPDWALADLGLFAGWLHAEWGLLLESSVTWRAPRASGDWQRLDDAAWTRYRGLLGHEHCPQNDHRDPGLLDAARILAFAGAQGDDMPTVDQIVTGILDAVPAGRDLNVATLVSRGYEQSLYNTGLLEDLQARIAVLEGGGPPAGS